jgi:hypothetical protein
MKASEVILRLRTIIDHYGDYEVEIVDSRPYGEPVKSTPIDYIEADVNPRILIERES